MSCESYSEMAEKTKQNKTEQTRLENRHKIFVGGAEIQTRRFHLFRINLHIVVRKKITNGSVIYASRIIKSNYHRVKRKTWLTQNLILISHLAANSTKLKVATSNQEVVALPRIPTPTSGCPRPCKFSIFTFKTWRVYRYSRYELSHSIGQPVYPALYRDNLNMIADLVHRCPCPTGNRNGIPLLSRNFSD